MPYYTYILYSEKFDRFYYGQTHNLNARLSKHNSGLVTSTTKFNFNPWFEYLYDFNAYPVGDRGSLTGSFDNVGRTVFFWTSEASGDWASMKGFAYDWTSIGGGSGRKDFGRPVRCLKD